jgi:hypothetical protein
MKYTLVIILNEESKESTVIPPLWSSSQSSWLQIQRFRVRFPALPGLFLEVVGLERGPLNLMSITEELLEWKISGSGSRNPRLMGRGDTLL